MSNAVLACEGLCKRFRDGAGEKTILHNINFSIEPGEKVAILGNSGCGKSTLLYMLGLLDTPTSGEIFVGGQNTRQFNTVKRSQWRNRHLGFIYQFHHLLGEFSALENVTMPLRIRGESKAAANKKGEALLEKVGLAGRGQDPFVSLSGGERQRVAIARALITEPGCVLADEPTGDLDSETADKVYETLMACQRDFNTAFVIVTHDESLAAKMDRTYRLVNGVLTSV